MTTSLKSIIEKRSQKYRVSESQFNASQSLTSAASWALWGDNVTDLTHFKDEHEPWGQLRRDVVLLGGNFGLLPEKVAPFKPLQNFHCGHENIGKNTADGRLRAQIPKTQVSGAFMTDVVKYVPTKTHAELLKRLQLPKDHKDHVSLETHFVKPLQAEINAVGIPSDAVFVLFGEGTLKVWEYVMNSYKGDLTFLDGITLAVTYRHYSASGSVRRQISGQFADHIKQMLTKNWPQTGADPREARRIFDVFHAQEKKRQAAALARWEAANPDIVATEKLKRKAKVTEKADAKASGTDH